MVKAPICVVCGIRNSGDISFFTFRDYKQNSSGCSTGQAHGHEWMCKKHRQQAKKIKPYFDADDAILYLKIKNNIEDAKLDPGYERMLKKINKNLENNSNNSAENSSDSILDNISENSSDDTTKGIISFLNKKNSSSESPKKKSKDKTRKKKSTKKTKTAESDINTTNNTSNRGFKQNLFSQVFKVIIFVFIVICIVALYKYFKNKNIKKIQ